MSRSYFEYVSADGTIDFYINDILVFQISDAGDITVSNDITSTSGTFTGIEYDYATLSSVVTVDTTTPNCDFAGDDYFELTMPDADKAITFSNPRRGNFLLKVQHHANVHTLTFPTAYFVGVTGTSEVVYSLPAGNTKYTIFNIFCDGTNYWISDVPFWAS